MGAVINLSAILSLWETVQTQLSSNRSHDAHSRLA
jgi:hypothetical protein